MPAALPFPLVASPTPLTRLLVSSLHVRRVDSPQLRAALQAEAPVLALLAKLDAEQASRARRGSIYQCI